MNSVIWIVNPLTAGNAFDTNAATKKMIPSVITSFQSDERPGDR